MDPIKTCFGCNAGKVVNGRCENCGARFDLPPLVGPGQGHRAMVADSSRRVSLADEHEVTMRTPERPIWGVDAAVVVVVGGMVAVILLTIAACWVAR